MSKVESYPEERFILQIDQENPPWFLNMNSNVKNGKIFS